MNRYMRVQWEGGQNHLVTGLTHSLYRTDRDFVMDFDPTQQDDKEWIKALLERSKCQRLIWALPGSTLGFYANYSQVHHYGTRSDSLGLVLWIAVLCSEPAVCQGRYDRDLPVEQPLNSWLFTVSRWNEVCHHS